MLEVVSSALDVPRSSSRANCPIAANSAASLIKRSELLAATGSSGLKVVRIFSEALQLLFFIRSSEETSEWKRIQTADCKMKTDDMRAEPKRLRSVSGGDVFTLSELF